LKLTDIISEVSKRRDLKLVYTNYNDRNKDIEWPLTNIQLDRLIDIHTILNFLQKRIKDEEAKKAIEAVKKAIKTGQPITDESLFGVDFAVDVVFGDAARGERFYIRDDGTVMFKFRLNQQDQPGAVNFDDNFLQFKSFIKSSLK